MIKIILEPADNGVIKRVEDDNINGAGEAAIYSVVYELEGDVDNGFEKTSMFLYDLIEDLGIEKGNKFNNKVLSISTHWGSKYQPKINEIQGKIRDLESELAVLKLMAKNTEGEV